MFVLALSRQDQLSRLEMPVGTQAHEVDPRGTHTAALVAAVPLRDVAPGAPEPGGQRGHSTPADIEDPDVDRRGRGQLEGDRRALGERVGRGVPETDRG